MAADVVAVMDALELEQVSLVGWSDGACSATGPEKRLIYEFEVICAYGIV